MSWCYIFLYSLIICILFSSRNCEIIYEGIDGNQFAFVKDRNIIDCILIANESVEDHYGQKKKGTILKLDLKKAYEYTNWIV